MKKKTYVIVGGSSGIGLEMTRRLSAEGHQVVVASRTADKLEGLAGVTRIALDITADTLSADALPPKLDGMVYCP